MSAMALAMGGHIRVGMEDNIYYSKGIPARSNDQFVQRIVRIAQAYGRDIASPQETRKILKLN
jgi:3-keto-5-aminohexanoate cleavage enzyme